MLRGRVHFKGFEGAAANEQQQQRYVVATASSETGLTCESGAMIPWWNGVGQESESQAWSDSES